MDDPLDNTARRHAPAHVDWKHLFLYGVLLAIVAVIGIFAIVSFIHQQTLVTVPEPLPKVTVVTNDPNSPLAASWVRLLTKAEMQPTLVPLETFDPIEGVVVFCDIETIPPRLAELLDIFVHRGGAIAFVGKPPVTPIGKFRLIADEGMADPRLQLSETVSPVLARLQPGGQIAVKPRRVSFLKESPRMFVDARWKDNSRAAVMHMEVSGARFLWFGIEPDMLLKDEPALNAMLRSGFRWVAGQPVSDGAVGATQVSRTLTPDARRDARQNRFAFSVDRMENPELLTIRMANRGGLPLANPTVKIWLPPNVTKVALNGDMIMTRNATLTPVPGEGACLVSLPRLTRNGERVMKLRIVETRPRPGGPPKQQQYANR
ncbi:MAG TPA: hypothetical protein VF618_27265 [Thermoanaerobaculia bacterium]